MLEKFRVDTQIVVTDMERAKDFYENKLGLTSGNFPMEGVVMYACGDGTSFFIYQRNTAPHANNTVMSFHVENIEELVASMKQKGVVFEDYDTEDFKTVDSIATMGPVKAAWFKDPDENILALFQM
jgi:predicted enzyme related to lactoylglutathione lyase